MKKINSFAPLGRTLAII